MPYTNGIEYTDLGTRDAASAARDQYKPPKAQPQPTAPAPEQHPEQPSQPTETAPVQDAASEARNAQIRDGAKSAYENYLGNFSANVKATNKELVATGKNLMDSAYVFNEAWNAVQNGTAFAGSIDNQRAFVMNAALAFGDATAKAHGWQLVDGANIGDVRHMTGFDKDTGTWNFVFKDKNGQYVMKSTTMDQVSSQLKNNGYYADTPAKDEGKSGSGKGGAPDNAGESGGASSKPRSEPGYGDISKQYNGFFEKTVDEEGNETGYTLSQQGEQFMRDELSVATGKERRWLISTLANKMAKEALDANAGAAEKGKDKTTYEQEYKRAVSALNEQYADPSAKSGEGPAPQAPVDALEAFAESVNVEKSGMKGAYDAASARRKERADNARAAAEQERRTRSVYVNGEWVTQGDIDDGKVSVKPEGTWENGIKRDALNAKKAENAARDAAREEPLVSDDERVKGLDEMLGRYGKEDDEAYDRKNADYFDKDGAQIDPSEVTKDANGNLVDKNGDPVRKEIWDDGTGGVATSVEGDRVRRDWSGYSDTQSKRNAEVFDAVMQMSPETRRRLAEETDGRGNLTERAKAVRSAILDYVDNENKRDSEAAIHQNGAVQNSDGSFSRTYRDSKGGLVMEETFDGGRMTEQGREARINALLDAELGPGGFADTRSYAQRTEAEDTERVAREEGDRTRDANNARISDERSAADAEAAAAIQAMQDKGVGRVRSQKWKDEQVLQRASQMTESEKQARAWANRDRSQPASAGEPPASEPENKPGPKPEPNPYGKEPLPEDPTERQEAVRSDKNYKSIVESEDGDGGYVLTDRAMATLRQKGIPVGYMTRDRVQNWIHNGDKYLDKHAAALKRIEANNKAANEREKARAREEVRRNQEAQQRSMTATSVNRLIAGAGIDITRQSDEDLLRLFPKKAEYEYAVQLRDSQRKQKKTVR